MKPAILMSAAFGLMLLLGGCDPFAGYHGPLSNPKAAHLDLSDATLASFDDDWSPVLFRYLAGNPRWEIREERGLRYAVRLEARENFETTLNGFVSTYIDGVMRQTRVQICFGREYGFGVEHGNVTRTKAGERDVAVVVEGDHDGTPGNSSYTIIAGGTVFLEIYDQAPEVARSFTQQAFKEVCAELKDVIAHRAEIEKSGILPLPRHYPKLLPNKSYLDVGDGMQPGIYLITAGASPARPGYAYVKVFKVQTGDRLSADRMTSRSTRHLGWSEDGKTVFPYTSEVTVYEGDWSSQYEARFELWHHAQDGQETMLAEKTRMINGWER